MKKLTSFFVLTGILLSSFFAQDANAYTGNHGYFIHETHTSHSEFSFHKLLIFSEINTEKEDSEKGIDEFQWLYIYVSSIKNEEIKNILIGRLISLHNHQQDKYHLPLFLVVKSIRI